MAYYNGSLKNLIFRLRKFKEILHQELKEEILENKFVIIEMVTKDQLYERGINGRDISIASYQPYAPRTIRVKIRKGQPTDRVTLKDTGEFYNSFDVVFDENGFYITSDDEKAKYLVEKYGRNIFRLTDENLTILLREYIRPILTEKMKAYLKNG